MTATTTSKVGLPQPAPNAPASDENLGAPALPTTTRQTSPPLAMPLVYYFTHDLRRGAPAGSPHWVLRYLVSGVSSLIATVLTLLLWQAVLSRNPFALFYAAVMFAAWYGGLGPGLLATGCSVLAIDTFLMPSFITAVPGYKELIQIGIFGGVALLISSLNAMRKRALAERDGLIALEQSAREEAERARRRSALLADASQALGAAALDSPAAIDAVAQRVVPELADWCLVDLAEQDGTAFRRVAVTHANADRRGAAPHLLCEYELSENAGGVARVIRSGMPELLPHVDAASLADLASREPSMMAFVELGATSHLITPLRAHGRTLGAMSLISCNPARAFGPHDLRLAEDLAHRLAVALDSARLYREAQDANRMKDEFLAIVSHELRTPLNAILGWSQLLHRGALDEPSVVQGMGAIERNAKSQARIIDDVLDVSRIIQGKLRLDTQPVDMRAILVDAVEIVRTAADAKRISIHASLDDDADTAVVTGDPERLRQVAWNLLSNAVKFTPDGGRVEVALIPASAGGTVELRVRDNGIGIEASFVPHVFERFRQADSSSTRAHGGLGLGLAIVRHLVELHGGTVDVHSEGHGRGATFTVRLPARADTPDATTNDTSETAGEADLRHHPADRQPDLTGLHVLLVEDEPDAREAFCSMLELCGAEVTPVGSARDALTAFRARRPDLILSDIGMPESDGYTLIREIRALENGVASDGFGDVGCPPTPAVAITAFATSEDRTHALRAGFQAHLAKPIGSAQLTAAIAAIVNSKIPLNPPPATEIDIPPAPPLSPDPLRL